MAYVVRIASRAERDLDLLYQEIRAVDSGAARRWYRGLTHAILSLEELPRRCPALVGRLFHAETSSGKLPQGSRTRNDKGRPELSDLDS